MGATITNMVRYFTHDGSLYSGDFVGYHLDYNDVQLKDEWGVNVRLTIVTDGQGASRVSVSGLVLSQESYSALRLDVNQSADVYKRGGTGGVALSKSGSGYIDVRLLPNTTYYVWLFCNGKSHLYYDQHNMFARITVSGTYGAAAAPQASNGVFGQAIPIRLTGGSSGARYTVTTALAGVTETLQTQGSAVSLNWTPAVETYAPKLTAAGSAAATITVRTYYSGTLAGTKSLAVTVSFAEGSLAPQLGEGWAAAAALNEGAAAGFACFIQGYSRARVSFDTAKIACQYGASVESLTVSCNGTTVSESPYDTPVLPGTAASLVCTATDSRGQSASETLSVSLLPYANPALTEISVFRSDAAGGATEDGGCIAAQAGVRCSELGGENACMLKVYARTVPGSFGGGQSMTPGVRKVLSGLSPDVTCEIRLEATDALGNTAVFQQTLATRKWAMKFRPDGSGVAFGKAAETDGALELPEDWTLRFGARTWLDLVYPVGSLYLSAENASPAALFGGTWEQIKDVFLLAAGDARAAGETGGSETQTVNFSNGYADIGFSGGNTNLHKRGQGPKFTPSNSSKLSGAWGGATESAATSTALQGTQTLNNLPPYLSVYVWKRTA